MTSSVASECFIVTGLHASRELEIVLNRGVGRPLKVPPDGRGRHQASPRAGGGPGPKASIQNLHRKGTKGPLHYQKIDEKTHPSSRLGPGAMSSIALQLSRCWTTSLVVLLVTPTSVVFGEDPSPTIGKYSCSVGNIVGLQTNSQAGTRFAGRIDADAQQKFFVTIEENKQLPEDSLALLGVATLSAVIHVLGAIRARWPQWLSVQQANNPAG